MKNQTSLTLVNGVQHQGISSNDRGLSYGDGLFETIKMINGSPCLLSFHQERLQQGLERLRFSELAIDKVDKALSCSLDQVKEFVAQEHLNSAVMKWIVTRGEGARGYSPIGADNPTVIVSVAPFSPNLERQNKGVRLHLCDTPLAQNPFLSGLKHLNRLEQVLARSEWSGDEYAEGVMLDTEGNVIEGTMSNLFWVKGGQVFTPDLHLCGIQGTLRRFIIQTLNEIGLPVQLVTTGLHALKDADEVFVCNSLIGIWPVTRLLDYHWDVGSITLNIQKRLDEAEV